jgi:hypothetical protein
MTDNAEKVSEWHRSAQVFSVFPGLPGDQQFRCQRPERGTDPAPTDPVRIAIFAWLSSLAALGCSGQDAAPSDGATPPPGGEEVSVELGVPAGDDGLDFAPLEDGSVLRLQTFGQGGTHLFLGVRCVGFGKRAFVGFTLTNLTNGREIVAPPPARAQLLFCHEDDERICDLVPVTVMTGGLTDPNEERDGLVIRIQVDVHNDQGAVGQATREVALSTEDLGI